MMKGDDEEEYEDDEYYCIDKYDMDDDEDMLSAYIDEYDTDSE